MRFSAPRSLYEPVRCKFSSFRKTSLPVISENVSERAHGVTRTESRIRPRAFLMSSIFSMNSLSCSARSAHWALPPTGTRYDRIGSLFARRNSRNPAALACRPRISRLFPGSSTRRKIPARFRPNRFTQAPYSGPNCRSSSARNRAASEGLSPPVEIAICNDPRRTTAG